MDNIIIQDIFHSLQNKKDIYKDYLGIFSIEDFNDLNILEFNQFSLILFIDNINAGLGHWVTIFKSANKLFFMDSYGKSPDFYRKNIKNKFKHFDYNLKMRLQLDFTTVCGAYAIYFIDLISQCKYQMNCFMKTFRNTFILKPGIKDKFIIKYLFKIYPILRDKKKINCVNLFCSKDFIINFRKCEKVFCG